jgi:hypothetical protein
MYASDLLKTFPILVAAAIVACTAVQVRAANEPYQVMPVELRASDLLPKSMLSGDGFTVNERVINEGVQNIYSLETSYGKFTVAGTDELRARIKEVRATMALAKLEDSDEFKEAAKGSVEGLVEGGKALVKEPVATTKGAVKGIGRWLGNVGSSITSDDPHQDNAGETLIGYDAVKRGYALELGVDPYTDFEPFQEHLSEVAKVSAAGGMLTSMTINLGPAGSLVGTVASVSRAAAMKSLLRDNPPVTLAKINKDKLMAMGVRVDQAEALLKNYNYTPTEMTLMVESLHRMGDIRGREIFVSFATSAPDDEVARFNYHYAGLMADYITSVEPADLVNVPGGTWLLTRTGNLVGVFPLDYLNWTRGVSDSTGKASAKADELGVKVKKILISGEFSPQARKALKSRGWEIAENASFTD